jgi:hypothetical protein
LQIWLPEDFVNHAWVSVKPRVGALEVDRIIKFGGLHQKRGWSKALARITFDLSALEFIDFTSAGRLLLLIEGASRHGIAVSIIPPAQYLRPGERALLLGETVALDEVQMGRQRHRIAQAIHRRRRVSRFLQSTGFYHASGLANLTLPTRHPFWLSDFSIWSEHIDSMLRALDAKTQETPHVFTSRAPGEQTSIFPFRWIAKGDTDRWSKAQERLIDFLHAGDAVMTRRDSISMVTTIVRELIDNVFEHAGHHPLEESAPPPAALLGCLAMKEARFAEWRDPRHTYPSDIPFNDWLHGRPLPLIRLFIGDSGASIPRTLEDSYLRNASLRGRSKRATATTPHIIHYSFEPMASRHGDMEAHGLGLASVRRYAKGYEGRVAVRAQEALAGIWSPAGRSTLFDDVGLAYSPGTILEVTLGLTLAGRRMTEPIQLATSLAQVIPVRMRLGGDPVAFAGRLLRAATEDADTGPNTIVLAIIDSWPSTRSERTELVQEVRGAARQLEGSAGLAILLPDASRADVRSAFALLDEIDEAEYRRSRVWDTADWTPPVLIISASGDPTWTGASKRIRGVLYEALLGELTLYEHLVSTLRARSLERDYISQNRDWISVDSVGHLELRVSLNDIENAMLASVATALERQLLGSSA